MALGNVFETKRLDSSTSIAINSSALYYAQAKKLTHQTPDGFPVQSFATLLSDLASRARVTYSLKTDKSGPTFQQVPPPTPLQAKAYELLNLLPVVGN